MRARQTLSLRQRAWMCWKAAPLHDERILWASVRPPLLQLEKVPESSNSSEATQVSGKSCTIMGWCGHLLGAQHADRTPEWTIRTYEPSHADSKACTCGGPACREEPMGSKVATEGLSFCKSASP